MNSFKLLGLMPADLAHPGIALALARSGATGLLDLEFTTDADCAQRNFAALLDSTTGPVGLRLVASRAGLARSLLERAGSRALTLMLSGDALALRELRTSLANRPGDHWLAEVTDLDSAQLLEPHFDGLVACGHETGGWVGEDSSYILMQKLAPRLGTPLYVRGGIGLRSAAACRSAGAAGVILDDALLLLAESPLPATLQAELARLNGAECKPYGELLGRSCRVYARPGSAALKLTEGETRAAEGGSLDAATWAQHLDARIGWHADSLLPLGQGIGLAAGYRRQYRSVGRLLQAVRRASRQQIDSAAKLGLMAAASPLAQSHGLRYPLAQGPMTRVSDSPTFAAAVSEQGALPFLALALMRGPQLREMLQQTRSRLGDRPWGVGMLGFIPQSLREEQCAEIWACKPSYALIAGGRPDQAAEFEQRGIPTYIHAPAPALLKLYLEQGARRFVFEGRECGGHVGPIASFPLWEQMIDVLLADVPKGQEPQVHVLFAGGIHNALSAAMVAVMAAPLAQRGIKVGCLMGTAYLFTREIVSSGAIVQGFQDEALACAHTLNLESGPGHASRCVDTPFARDFYETRRRLIREGRSAEDIRDALEDLNLGRLRIASKGLDRDADGKVVVVAPERQRADGMYMIGQVATLRDQVVSLAELHEDVCSGAQRRLQAQLTAHASQAPDARPADVAIVGIGLTLPKANCADDYWQLILRQAPVLREAPNDRWDSALIYDPDPKARDKVYSKWGGFLDEIPFDPLKFGIPPNSMKSIDPLQLLTLETAARTLADAGYSDGGFDRENSSVILGAGGGAGDLGQQYAMRAELPRFVENPSAEVWDRLPEWTEESFAGTLLNVAAGRVANRLDFGGVNYTVDAACGSSLAAIGLAVHELETGRSNFVLAGGFDTTQSAYAFTAFAKTQALSASGQPRTFDQDADGIAISEGVAMVALKRLADAERDGDRIYAVIKSTAGSSDGKALGLTAPRTEGQVRALQRAYRKAGFSPATLDLVEAHGTGTPVGDRTEAQTVARALLDAGAAADTAAIGSVKTLLGHTKAAAGAAGLIKIALSLYHRVLPGHFGVSKPIDVLADPAAPIYLLKDARPWLAPADHPRRGAASAFGFGGTNFHAVLEEYADSHAPIGARRWPTELFLFRADDDAQLVRELGALRAALQPDTALDAGELAQALARQVDLRRGQPISLAIVATDLAALARDVDTVLAQLTGAGTHTPLPPHIRLNRTTPAQAPSLAFLFPGQGAQYVNMGREAAIYLDDLRSALEFAERVLHDELPERLSARMYPPGAFDAETERLQARAITDTRYAQPAIGTLSLGYLRLAERLGLEAVATAGHSYGEYSALMAAGVIDAADFLRLSAARGRAMAEATHLSVPGGMAAVQCRREVLTPLLADYTGVRVANHNAPEQCVISGPRAELERALAALEKAGLRAVPLPVSGAFHTELVAPAKTALSQAIRATRFGPARYPVYANASGQPYPPTADQMQAQLDEHLLSSVEFVAEIEAMYAAGARVFLELGPRGICTGLARQILAGRDARAIALDGGSQGLRGLLLGLAELYATGVVFEAGALYANRELGELDLSRLAEKAAAAPLASHVWMLSGGCARPQGDPVRRTGKLPALTLATADAARRAIEARMEAAIRERLPTTATGSSAAPSAALNSEALIAYQQTMRQFLALQERVVQQFLGAPGEVGAPPLATVALPPVAAPSLSAAAAPATPAPAPAVVAVTVPAASSALDFKTLLLNIVAERTGYPTDMLGLDADLEADLGIDSIKRVEIIGALQKALPAALATAVKQQMERYTQAKTLSAILAALQALLSQEDPTAADPAAVSEPVAVDAASPADQTLPRYVIRSRPAPLATESVARAGLALLLGPRNVISDGLMQVLTARGLHPVLISDVDPESLYAAVQHARERHGPVRALIHLHGLLAEPMPAEFAHWQRGYTRDLLSLFHALKVCLTDLDQACVLAASRLGGTFGRDAIGEGLPLAGGANGMLNCLRIEVPGCTARAVDFDGHSDQQIVALLAAELFADDPETEAGYIGQERYGTATIEQALGPSPFTAQLRADEHWVVLATGGARGITAQIVEALACPGMHVVLLGRTPEPAAEAADTAVHSDAAGLRTALLAMHLARGERPRPVDVDREVARILVERELRANLARLRAAGVLVDYRVCDVRDTAAFSELIDALYVTHGRIDAVIHGAGVIEDKLLADKSTDSFARVLGTKLDPAFVLAHRLRPDSLKLLAFFTSVAGRYGNRGQSDYAAANEALNRLAWELHRRWTQTRVVAINWGPWDAGMASDGIRRQLRERGMEPIPVAAGTRFFLDELANGPRHDVELVVGQGPWGALASRPAVADKAIAAPHYSFVHKPPRIGVGGTITLDHRLNLASEPWLRDHIVEGRAVVPLAIALETLAQFVALGWPDWQIAEVSELQALSPLTVDPESGTDTQLRAKAASHSEPGSQIVTVQWGCPQRSAEPWYRASMRLVTALPRTDAAQLAGLTQREPVESGQLYAQYLCRGPRLRALQRVDAVAANGAMATLQTSTPDDFTSGSSAAWLFDPALIDALSQLAFVWAQQQHDKGVVPTRLGRVRRYGTAPVAGPVRLVQHFIHHEEDGRLIATAEFVDASGMLRYAVDDAECSINVALSRLAPRSPDYVQPSVGERA